MAKRHSYGVTLLTDMTDGEIEKTLDKKALADLKTHSKPQAFALTQVTSEYIKDKLEVGTIFTLTDMFLILQQQGHTETRIKSLQSILARLVRDKDFPLESAKIAGRQRGYQKT